MPKLLQICVEGNTGSTGRLAEAIGNHVLSRGWESYIAFGRYPRPSSSVLIRIGNSLSIILHGLITRVFDKHCLGSKYATIKLVKQIKRIKPDIIHLHHIHGYYINMKVLFDFLSQYNMPVVWTFHDCWSMTGHCTHFTAIGCERWKTQCFECPQTKEYPASLVFDNSKSNFTLKKSLFNSVRQMTVVSVSNWLNNVVGESFMKNVSRKVIYNGIDINKFHPQCDSELTRTNFRIGSKFMILGVASPWSEKKGLGDFIKLSHLIDNDTAIVLVGLNKEEISRLPKNIIGIEKTESQEALKNLYASANLFINFSFEETFGLTTAEALACGTPSLVYNTTACPEIVDDKTGFVIDFKDFNRIIEIIKIVKVLGKDHFIGPCRDRAIKLFNLDSCLKSYHSLYQNHIPLNKTS